MAWDFPRPNLEIMSTVLPAYLGTRTGIPINGQTTKHIRAKTAIRMILGGIPYMRNSPLVNCLESYAMALGAAPTKQDERHARGGERCKHDHVRGHRQVLGSDQSDW